MISSSWFSSFFLFDVSMLTVNTTMKNKINDKIPIKWGDKVSKRTNNGYFFEVEGKSVAFRGRKWWEFSGQAAVSRLVIILNSGGTSFRTFIFWPMKNKTIGKIGVIKPVMTPLKSNLELKMSSFLFLKFILYYYINL